MIIDGEHALSTAKVIWMVYNNFNLFAGMFRLIYVLLISYKWMLNIIFANTSCMMYFLSYFFIGVGV